MPTYEMKCPTCDVMYELRYTISDYSSMVDGYKDYPVCGACPGVALQRTFVTPPNVAIPSGFTYDGRMSCPGGRQAKSKQEVARVPINIIDHNPDGSATVTRIGADAGDLDDV